MSATLMWALIATVVEALALVALQIIDHRRPREYRGTEANHHHSRAGRSARLSGPPNAAIHAAAALGAPPGEGADPRLDLPVEYRDDAILAWKTAYVVWHDGRWMFRALTREEYYGADERARCRERFEHCNSVGDVLATFYDESDHEVPDPACDCGFYATAARSPSNTVPMDHWTLRVELTGTVIEHDRGYRASRQRVLGVVEPWCAYCGSRPIVGFHVAPTPPRTMASRHGEQLARAVCAACAARTETTPYWRGDDVLAVLGVERHRGPDA